MSRTERVTNDVRIRVGETRSLKNVRRQRRWDMTETGFYGRDEGSYHSIIKEYDLKGKTIENAEKSVH